MDSRRHDARRYPVRTVALMARGTPSGAAAVVHDLSRRGARVRTSKPAQVGERVSVSFRLPGIGPLVASGKVAWTRGKTCGITFTTLGPRFRSRFDRFARRYLLEADATSLRRYVDELFLSQKEGRQRSGEPTRIERAGA